MMIFPVNWSETRQGLHQALQVLLLARLAAVDPLPNALRYGMYITPTGASTGTLNTGGVLSLDYTQGIIQYAGSGGGFGLTIQGQTQQALIEATFAQFRSLGYDLQPDVSRIAVSSTPIQLELEKATAYAEVQWRVHRALAVLKAKLSGPQTPVLVWAHGFDVSTLWFAGNGFDDKQDAHINFGFSPGTPDVGAPYVFFYVWPALPEMQGHLPEKVRWHTAWSSPGGVMVYDDFKDDPETVIVETLYEVYQTAIKLMAE